MFYNECARCCILKLYSKKGEKKTWNEVKRFRKPRVFKFCPYLLNSETPLSKYIANTLEIEIHLQTFIFTKVLPKTVFVRPRKTLLSKPHWVPHFYITLIYVIRITFILSRRPRRFAKTWLLKRNGEIELLELLPSISNVT